MRANRERVDFIGELSRLAAAAFRLRDFKSHFRTVLFGNFSGSNVPNNDYIQVPLGGQNYSLRLMFQARASAGSALTSVFSVQPLSLCVSVVKGFTGKTTTETPRLRGCTEKNFQIRSLPERTIRKAVDEEKCARWDERSTIIRLPGVENLVGPKLGRHDDGGGCFSMDQHWKE